MRRDVCVLAASLVAKLSNLRKSIRRPRSERIEYYDDEELDRYVGTSASGYTEREVEEFREILLSLDTEEVPGWVRSLQLRGIEFPESLRPELYLIVSENRDYHAIVGRHEATAIA